MRSLLARSFLMGVLTLAVAAFTLVPKSASSQTSDSLREIMETGDGAESWWSLVVRDDSGDIVEEYNGKKLIRPASVQKLVTSAAILHLLGPEYRYRTRLYASAIPDGGRLKGDLLVRGSGDPTMNNHFYTHPFVLFESWAERLKSLGIRHIEGDLVGNDAFFDDVPYPRGWEWDDLSYYYGVEISALSFNRNVVDLEVLTDGEVGTVPEIRWFPFNTPYVEFVNEQLIIPPGGSFDESYRRILGTNTIVLRSRLPQGFVETEPLSVGRPSLFFIDTFKRYLERRGIQIEGEARVERKQRNWSAPDLSLLDEHVSVPLYEIIREKNRNSNNFYAEMLVKTLAAERYSTEGTTERGLEAVQEFLASTGIDTSRVTMRDASGMAPANLIRTVDLNQLLFELQSMDHFERYQQSLAVAGHSGTLRYRFHNTPVQGQFFGKTGFTSGVRTLAGYLTTRNGRALTVTIATNNYRVKTRQIDQLHQRILEDLYSYY